MLKGLDCEIDIQIWPMQMAWVWQFDVA